ncbi:MAG: nitroreductase [Clostridium sp.]|nr:nitroreductase [Clostridium sp.]
MEEIYMRRHSVRAYTTEPIGAGTAAALRALIDDINRDERLRFALITDEPGAFGTSLMARYGSFRNVRNYFALSSADGADSEVELGRQGERLVLEATALGLQTCWVGLTYNRAMVCQGTENPRMKLRAVIAVGHGVDQGRQRRLRPAAKLVRGGDEALKAAPEWFRRGIEAVRYAPSALNQQAYRFRWAGGDRVEASRGLGFYTRIDLGIALCHFALGAANPSLILI